MYGPLTNGTLTLLIEHLQINHLLDVSVNGKIDSDKPMHTEK